LGVIVWILRLKWGLKCEGVNRIELHQDSLVAGTCEHSNKLLVSVKIRIP